MSRSARSIETDFLGIPVSSTKKINSKAKGNKNELECAKMLKGWTGVPFARVPSSGGLRWLNTVNACGDLICEDQEFNFPFAVETKHLKDLALPEKLTSRSKVFTIYLQALRDAERAKKCPMMCLRTNGMEKMQYMIYLPFKVEGLEIKSSGTGKVNSTEVNLYGYLSCYITRNVIFEVVENLGNAWNINKY